MKRRTHRWWIVHTLVILAGCSVLSAANASSQGSKGAGETSFRDCSECPEMIVVPAGNFVMNIPRSEEMPIDGGRHAVTIHRPLAVGIYDVTRAEYRAFMLDSGRNDEAGCHFFDGQRWVVDPKKTWRHPGFQQTDRDPVVCVSWNDAQAYILWLNSKVHATEPNNKVAYRLLSGTEWEYAARGGTATAFYWGEDASHEYANYGAEQCYPCGVSKQGKDRWFYTSPVGSFGANPFGLYDVFGNVWQWTQDCRHSSFTDVPADETPWTSGACQDRILRGGSWLDPSKFLALETRNPWPPDDRNNANGFRVARSLD
jgi:formylglycine-generating enzyme required for sulfatase activity